MRGYGRGGYNLGGSAEVEFWGHSPEVSIAGIGACQNGSCTNSGRAGGRAVAAAGTSPGPGLGIKVASGPGGALGGKRVIIQYGGGVRSSPSKSCRISFFYQQSIFVPLIFSPFPSGIQNLVQVGGS